MSTGQEVQAFSLCCAKVRGKKQNAFYPDERPVHTLDDLLKIAQFDHTPGFFKDAHRGKLSWYWQECIVLDVDNTDGGKVTNPADIARDFPGVGHYIIYSRHHNKPKVKDDGKGEYPAAPRFHVYFPINSQFKGAEMVISMQIVFCILLQVRFIRMIEKIINTCHPYFQLILFISQVASR